MPSSIDASGIGLYGILNSGIPVGIRADDIRRLGGPWEGWRQTVLDQLSLIYDGDRLDVPAQKSSLAALREEVSTLKTASSNPENRFIIVPLTTIHARLDRRVTLAESILQTLEEELQTDHEGRVQTARSNVIEAIDELEEWLVNEIPGGSAWLSYIRSKEIRSIPDDNTSTELVGRVYSKLADSEKMENEAQREFIRRPQFDRFRNALKEYIRLLETQPSKTDEAKFREALALLVRATEWWEQERSPRALREIEEKLKEVQAVCGGGASKLGAAINSLYLSRDLLERPEEFCKVISKAVGFSIAWDKSRIVPGEWVLTPAGPSFEFGRAGRYGRPNLFFYGYGTREQEAYRLTLKLNLNGTPDHEEGKEKLIEYANSLLAIDDQSLPPVLLRLIRSTESVVDANPDQSDAQLLHSETGRDYRIELHYETGRYTALILHLIHHDPAENQESDEPREVTTKPDPSPEEMRNVGLERSNALLVAQKHVKKQLKSPSTAAFPGIFDDRPEVRSLGSNKYRIRSWVDAQNGFGATIRSNFECVVETDGKGGWRVVTFKMDD